MRTTLVFLSVAALTASANAAIVVATSQGEYADLAVPISATDLLEGLIPTELPGDNGWHPATPPEPARLVQITDGADGGGLNGLLNDFPSTGNPTKKIAYDLGSPTLITGINVYTGNDGRDGRVFHTYTVAFSNDGTNYGPEIYVQSHASGTLNNAGNNQWRNVLTQLTDDSGPLATAQYIRFHFYAVDNTGGQMRDPFDGVNPYTSSDDGLSAAFVSPLLWEIDVVPEPATIALLGLGGWFLRRRRA